MNWDSSAVNSSPRLLPACLRHCVSIACLCGPPGPEPEHALRPEGVLHQDDRSPSRERSDGNEPPEAAKICQSESKTPR
jgi:hypothetical protein